MNTVGRGAEPRAPVSDVEVLENARAAAAELRAQIDQQLRTADSLDTRATALLTVGTGAVALIAGRLTVETDLHRLAGIAFGAAALWLLGSCLGALSSRSAFAYGADADALVPELEHHSTDVIALTIAKALRDARNREHRADRRQAQVVSLGSGGALRPRHDHR